MNILMAGCATGVPEAELHGARPARNKSFFMTHNAGYRKMGSLKGKVPFLMLGHGKISGRKTIYRMTIFAGRSVFSVHKLRLVRIPVTVHALLKTLNL